jgi:DNA-binding winged helix-turn-helix (wHTH) protein/Tol biopolymer transport system component
MSLQRPELYEFGPFRLEPREHVLRRADEPVVLPPKAFDLLVVLVERAGRLVTKEELLKEVWGPTVVEEANLSYTVSLLRKALGDGRGAPQYIETVATRGYRFVAPVTRIAPSAAAEAESGITRQGPRKAALLVAAGVVVVSGVFLLGLRWLSRASAAVVTPVRFELPPPEGASFSARPTAPNAAVSPDGNTIAFVASTAETVAALWVRDIQSVQPRMLRGTSGVSAPFWSPDGRWLAFFSRRRLQKISADGGPIDTLSDAAGGTGGSWSRNGIILFGGPPRPDNSCAPLHTIASTGGTFRAVTQLDTERGELCHLHPAFLPDGQSFLYTVLSTSGERTIHIASLDEGRQAKRLIATGSNAVFSPAGYLLYVRDDTLVAHRFDTQTWQLAEEPIRIVEGVIPAPTNRRAPFATGGGTLVYRLSSPLGESELVWMDRQGARVGEVGPRGRYQSLALSPDGSRLAVDAFNRYGTASDIRTFELATGTSEPVTFDPAHDRHPFWSRDGTRLFFSSSRTSFFSVYEKNLSRGAPEQPLVPSGPPRYYIGRDVSPDGALVLVDAPGLNSNLSVLNIKDQKLQPLLTTAASEEGGQFAPDGRWVAYSSDELGVHEVFVQPFPPSGAKWQVSRGGGKVPRWRRDGRELFYLAPDGSMMAVPVEPGEPFRVGKAQTLFRARRSHLHGVASSYAVNAAGDRFLVNIAVEPESRSGRELTVVLNWTAGLGK